MKDLIIFGAGGFGREVAETVRRINAAAKEPVWNLLGFADDDAAKGPLVDVEDHPGAAIFLAVGDNRARETLRTCRTAGTCRTFATLVDPSAVVFASAKLGEGVFVGPLAVVSANAEIGAFAIVNARASVGHDSKIGAFAQVSPGASLSGGTTLGARALMGTNSSTVPGVTIGADATVAAGTPAYRDVAEGATLSPFGTLRI